MRAVPTCLAAVALAFCTSACSDSSDDDDGWYKPVSWEEAVELIRAEKAREVWHDHSRHVRIKTKDGREFSTTEPKLGDVAPVIRSVDPKGETISYVTE